MDQVLAVVAHQLVHRTRRRDTLRQHEASVSPPGDQSDDGSSRDEGSAPALASLSEEGLEVHRAELLHRQPSAIHP